MNTPKDSQQNPLNVGDRVWIPYYNGKRYGYVESIDTAVKDFVLIFYDGDEDTTAVWSGDLVKEEKMKFFVVK
jgi:hypothetical protein